jgi:hypothetical protein
MTWKEKVENNITLFVLGLLATGFGSGFTASKLLPGGDMQSQTAWQLEAKKANWTPTSECPAYPVSISIASPGNGSVVKVFASDAIQEELVIHTSRPLPRSSSVGIISNVEGNMNYYLSFPSFSITANNMVFREYGILEFHKEVVSAENVNLWAVIVDDERKYGSIYSSLEQITSSSKDVTLSQKITLRVERK